MTTASKRDTWKCRDANAPSGMLLGAAFVMLLGSAPGQAPLPQNQPLVPSISANTPLQDTSSVPGTIREGQLPGGNPPAVAVQSGAYVVGVGDVLDITVFDTPELSGRYVISDTGDLRFPLIGSVHAEGLRSGGISQLIQDRLASGKYVLNPQVNVLVVAVPSQNIAILGEVTRPGVYFVPGEQKLFDLIALASGLTTASGQQALILHHEQSHAAETVVFRRPDGELGENDVQLHAGDTVIIERAPIIYVLGAVSRPGGFVMQHGSMGVLEALSLSAGPNKDASRTLHLVRKQGTTLTSSPVELKQIVSGRQPDVVLMPGDIVYVSDSLARDLVQVGLPGIVAAAAGAAIYAGLDR